MLLWIQNIPSRLFVAPKRQVNKSQCCVRAYSTDSGPRDADAHPVAPLIENGKMPYSFWKKVENRREFLVWLSQRLNLKSMDDWYKVPRLEIVRHGGVALLTRYHKNSVSAALSEAFPDHQWQEWRFAITPRGFWRQIQHQRKFLEALYKSLQLKSMDDWYDVTPERVSAFPEESGRLKSLLKNYYNGSLASALQASFPEHEWKAWRFSKLPSSKSDQSLPSPAELREFVEQRGREHFGIEQLDDWYRISNHQLQVADLFRFAARIGGLYQMFKTAFPEHTWDASKFAHRNKKTAQWLLLKLVLKLFPNERVIEEYKTPGEITFARSQSRMEMDIFIPALNLGFEYHGVQHYQDVYQFGQRYERRRSDREKVLRCRAAGITVIELPFWWNPSLTGLRHIICATRPDLSPQLGISSLDTSVESTFLPPATFLSHMKPIRIARWRMFRECEELVLGQVNEEELSGKALWVSQIPRDGILFRWQPSLRVIFARSGAEIRAPVTFLDRLPQVEFDGMLRFPSLPGKEGLMDGLFNTLQPDWNGAQVVGIDVIGSHDPYPKRLSYLKGLGVIVPEVSYFTGISSLHLSSDMDTVIVSDEKYQPGFSRQFFKVVSRPVLYARFEIQPTPLEPKKVILALDNGTLFHAQCEVSLANVIPGDVAQLAYDGFNSHGQPQSPVVVEFRPDLCWEDVLLARRERRSYETFGLYGYKKL